MIRALAAICVGLAVVVAAAPEGHAADRQGRGVLRVLFIGNSYTRFNDLPHMVEAISASAPGGPLLRTSRETRGGYDLRGHWRQERVRQRIATGRFHAVVIQGHSLAPLTDPAQMADYAGRFARHAQAAGSRLFLFQTWARHRESRVYQRLGIAGPDAMLDRIDAVYGEVGRELGVVVAPVGRAWSRGAVEAPDVELHRRDGTHPALAGTYLSACVVFGTLTGLDPRHTSYVPWRLPPSQAARLREVAARSLLEP